MVLESSSCRGTSKKQKKTQQKNRRGKRREGGFVFLNFFGKKLLTCHPGLSIFFPKSGVFELPLLRQVEKRTKTPLKKSK
jgi:hypothetical protein